MSFLPTLLNPALLWLLPLAAIPLVLHLFTLQRLKTVELSTYRFLFDSYVQQRRKMQFLQVLLAMLRTLFLLLLVLVICRPVLREWGGLFQSGSGRDVILLMDCSASMNAQSKGQSAFDRAKDAAKVVIGRLNPDDRITLIRVAGRPEEVFSRFNSDSESIRERIDNLKTSPSRANLFAALNSLFGPDAKRPTTPLIYFFTDSQKSSWNELERQPGVIEKMIPAETPIVMVQVGTTATGPNLAITGNAPSRQRAVVGLPVVLRAKVVNYSAMEEEATLRLFIDDKELPEHRAHFKLKPGEELIHPFAPFEPSESGSLRGRFEIGLTGKGTDAFPDDDRFLFTLAVQPKVRVVVVNGGPAIDPYENESIYLRAALAAEKNSEVGSSSHPRELARSLEVIDVTENELNPVTIKDASVVILANCGQLMPNQFVLLREFVSGGGGLLIFPGEKVNPSIYNDQFFTTPLPQSERITPVQLGPPIGDINDAFTFQKLARVQFDHPVLNVFEQLDRPDVRYFDRVLIKKRFPLKLKDASGATVLFELSDRTPGLVQSRYGDGVVFLAAFPLNVKWTNFPASGAEFVPMMLRMITYAQRRADVEGPSVVLADGVAELSVASHWMPVSATVKDAADRVTDLVFERAGGRYSALYDQTSDRGYYQVTIRGERDPTKQAKSIFAVNLTPEESNIAQIAEDEARSLLPTAKLTFVDASAEAQQEKGTLGEEREVWRPLIGLLFLIILTEFFISTLRGAKASNTESESVGARIRRNTPIAWVRYLTGRDASLGE